MADVTLIMGTREFLHVEITANVLLSDQDIEVSIDMGTTWLPAEWVPGDPTTTREARILLGEGSPSGTDYPLPTKAGTYKVRVRLTSDPERPVIASGTMKVIK